MCRSRCGCRRRSRRCSFGRGRSRALPGRSREWLSVIDARTNAVEGVVPAGLFPRELKVTADGKTLLVTNFNSKSLELVDIARLTGDYFAQQQPVMTAGQVRPLVRQHRIQLAGIQRLHRTGGQDHRRLSAGDAVRGRLRMLHHHGPQVERGVLDVRTRRLFVACARGRRIANAPCCV